MLLKVEHQREGGFHEFRTAVGAMNTSPIPRRGRFLDASTIVPNCRAAEIMMSLWGRNVVQEVSTDVTMSGTVGEYAAEWNLEPPAEDNLRPWFDFYDTVGFIRSDRVRAYAPFALIPNASECVLKERARRIKEAAVMLGRNGKGEAIEVLDLLEQRPFTFDLALRAVKSGRVVGTFPCPACSLGATPTYHAVRRGAEFDITHPKSDRVMKCKATRAWKAKVTPETSLKDLVSKTGFILGGRAGFNLINEELQGSEAVFLRDYSNPRGVSIFARELWGDKLWISTRLTIRDAEGRDIGWEELRQALERDTAVFSSMLDLPVVSDGRTVAITF